MIHNVKLRLPAALVLVFALGACATAARIVYPLQSDPLKSKPGIYKLDPAHANIIFAVNHLGFSIHHGRFNEIEGSLELDTSAPENSRVFIKINTASIDTNNSELDQKLRGRAMFNTAAFPAATFESASLLLTGEKTATITGFLTIKDIRKSITIDADFIGSGTNPLTGLVTVGFSGSAHFKRSAFGLTNWLPLVGDNIELIIEAEFNRAKN